MPEFGIHLSLSPEQTRHLLRATDDAELIRVLSEWSQDEDRDPERIQETDRAWNLIHRCLTEGLPSEDRSSPLAQGVFGGQRLNRSPETPVYLVPAEEVRPISNALMGVGEARLRERFLLLQKPGISHDEAHFRYLWHWFRRLQLFYRLAALENRAVVFALEEELSPGGMLSRWQFLAGDESRERWEPASTAGFFQAFRPTGEGVAAAFEGVNGGEEILPRLRQVYQATAEGWRDEQSYDMYFIVRRPRLVSEERVLELVRTHLLKVRELVEELAELTAEDPDAWESVPEELLAFLDPPPALEVVVGKAPSVSEDEEAPEALLYFAVAEFMSALEPADSYAHLMKEAFYTIACDHNLQWHLLWPLYQDATELVEPFAPYFELWKHGIEFRFEITERVMIYLPEGCLTDTRQQAG